MIFASCGHRAPFNRLMRLLDGWAATANARLFAHVGSGGYRPKHFTSVEVLTPRELSATLDQSSLVIADTNIELLIAARERRIPMIVMPRQPIFGEDVGPVQSALAARISQIPGLTVVADEAQLIEQLERGVSAGETLERPAPPDRSPLIASILGELAR